MKKIMFSLWLATVTTFASAQVKDDGQELINTFFDHYKNKGYEVALRYTLSTNRWIRPEGNEMNGIVLQLSKELVGIGEYIGYEELKSKRVGSRLRIASYLVYYQRDPIRFTFELYKSSGGWEFSDFKFDSNFDDEINESIKLTGDKE